MPKMSDAQLAHIHEFLHRAPIDNWYAVTMDRLLDALITERKMVEWLAEHAACAYKGEYEYAEGENAAKWIAAAEEAVK